MRRHAQHRWAKDARQRGDWGTWVTARAEHAILWLYWRALVGLAVLLVLFTALCTYGGGFVRPGSMTNQALGGIAATSSAPAGTAVTADTSLARPLCMELEPSVGG